LAWKRLTSAQFITRDLVTAIVIDPSDPGVWYAGTKNAGVYKSINGGVSWLPAQNGLGRASVDTLIIDPDDPNTLYAGLIMGGVYKTTNGGQNWQAMNESVEISGWQETSVVVMDPLDSQHLFFLNGWWLYESEDGGESWDEITWTSLTNNCGILTDLSFSPLDSQKIFIVIDDPGSECGGVYLSMDGGYTWEDTELSEKNVSFTDLWVDHANGDHIYAFYRHEGYSYLSSDGGQTWAERPYQGCGELVFHPENGSEAYCVSPYGRAIKKTINGGQSWQDIGNVKSQAQSFGAIFISPHDPKTILVGGDGLFISTDGGYSWEERSNGLGTVWIELYINAGRTSALYMKEKKEGVDENLYHSPDQGSSWELITDRGRDLAFDAGGQTLYRISNDENAILIFNNEGKTWEKTYFDNEFLGNITAHPLVSGRLYLSSGEGFSYSTDGGATWDQVPGIDGLNLLALDSSQGDVAYGVYGPGGVWKSLDAGENWQECAFTKGWSRESDSVMIIEPGNNERVFLAKQGEGVVLSEDGCVSWTSHNKGLGNLFVNAIALDPQNLDTIYAGTDNGAYVSFDGGGSWHPINDGLLGGLVIYSIVVDEESNVYAATPLGIFELEQQ
jgi:photosystem II stability/assembly factor-like uncharacterized protein